MREHNEAVNRLDFITGRAPITVEYAPGKVEIVDQHDGSKLRLRQARQPITTLTTDLGAMSFLQQHAAKGEIVTGLIFVDQRPRGSARTSQYGRGAAQHAEREGALPRLRGAREDQCQPAVEHFQENACPCEGGTRRSRTPSKFNLIGKCSKPQTVRRSRSGSRGDGSLGCEPAGQSAALYSLLQPGPARRQLPDDIHHPLRRLQFDGGGRPVSSTLLRLDRIAGQPERPPSSMASGTSH